jgi:Cof subfamily protein (haloacid dehalogenase superfamily)
MIISDLDGTLLNNMSSFHKRDMETLFSLGKKNIIRVIATGRNLFSAKKILNDDFPIDYLIFSSGAGVYNWKTKELIHSNYLKSNEVKEIAKILINNDVDFMIHEMIPENHKFVYHKAHENNFDFNSRCELYKDFAEPLVPDVELYKNACQIIAIFPNKVHLFENIKRKFSDIKVIRATSPLDGESIWMEIFPIHVSKAYGVKWLCNYLGIDKNLTLSVGNDYNDLDLLEYTKYSYLVENSPAELKNKFDVCESNQNCGFSDALSRHIIFDK